MGPVLHVNGTLHHLTRAGEGKYKVLKVPCFHAFSGLSLNGHLRLPEDLPLVQTSYEADQYFGGRFRE